MTKIPKEERLFSTKMLNLLIWPLVIEQVLAVTVGMADTFMVNGYGDSAISGVNLVDSINILFINLFAALATGGAVIASQFLGRGDKDSACQSAKQLIFVVTIFSLAIMAIALAFGPWILKLIYGRAGEEVIGYGIKYFFWSAISYPFLAVYNACAALYRSMNNSRLSMMTSAFMNVVNVGGNAVLIYGFDMGVSGAAIASLISRALAAIVMLLLITRKKNAIHIDSYLIKPNGAMIKRILGIGIPSGVENGMFQTGKIIVQSQVSALGSAAIAANSVAGTVGMITNIPGAAIGLAMITVVGQCMGAGKPEQASFYTKRLTVMTYIALGAICVSLLFLAEPIVGLFQELSDPRTAIEILWICCIVTIFVWPLSFTVPNALRAAGDAKFTMVISLVSMLVFRVGCSFLFVQAFQLGVHGVWFAMYIDWVIRAIIFPCRFKIGKWKKIRLTD